MTLQELKDNIKILFNPAELKELCFSLNIDYEDLPGRTHNEKVQELVQYCKRHDLLNDLENLCRELRPNWENNFENTTSHLQKPQIKIHLGRFWLPIIIILGIIGAVVIPGIFKFESVRFDEEGGSSENTIENSQINGDVFQAGRDQIINPLPDPPTPEFQGRLIPDNLPSPQICEDTYKSTDHKIFFGGDVASISFPVKSLTVLEYSEKEVITLSWNEDGILISTEIFDNEGKIIAEIIDNSFRANPNNIFYIERDEHQLAVFDQFNEEALFVHLINETSVQIRGKFQVGKQSPFIVTNESIKAPDGPTFMGGNCHSVQGDGSTIFSYGSDSGLSYSVSSSSPIETRKLIQDISNYFENEQYTDAMTLIESAIELEPTNSELFIWKGAVNFRLKYYEEALENFDKALAIDPSNESVYEWRGATYHLLERNEEAVNDLIKAINFDPLDENAYAYLGAAYSALGEYEKALENLTKAIEINPSYPLAYIERGIAIANQDNAKINDGIADLTIAISLNPSSLRAYQNRGSMYEVTGDAYHALADYQSYLEIASDINSNEYKLIEEKVLYLESIIALSADDFDEALSKLNQAIKLDANNADLYVQRAITNIELGNIEKAITDLNFAIDLDSNNVVAYNERGILFREYGFILDRSDWYDYALSDFNQAIILNPDNASYYAQRAATYIYKDEIDLALTDFERALELNPYFATVYIERGIMLANQGDLEAGILDLNHGLTLEPRNEKGLRNRAGILEYMGNFEQAISDYQLILELNPQTSDREQIEKSIVELNEKLSNQ